jgi:hypothetical protein
MNRHPRLLIILMLCAPTVAGAAPPMPDAGVISTAAPPASLAPPPTPLRYDLPWQLRPVSTGNVVRIDSAAAAFNDADGNLDVAVTTVLSASYQLTPDWAPTIRLGFVGNDAPGAALDGSSFVNPMVGATYVRCLGRYRLALFGAATIPLGTGSGDARYVPAAKTNAASIMARPADTAMFAVDYTTAIVGADLAYMNHGFTAQVEATGLQYVRVRGDSSEHFRTQAAVGLHVGTFIGSHFSLGGELHHQRWLSRVMSVSGLAEATTTVAAGPRAHFMLGKRVWIRPGLSVVRGLDARGFGAPLLTPQTTAVQIDVPVTF